MRDIVALRQQVKDIAASENITIAWVPIRHGAAGTADARSRKIVVRYICSVESYAVAMHELGHILSGVTSPREGEPGWSACKRLANEAAAWDWALQQMPVVTARSKVVTSRVVHSMRDYLWFAHCHSDELPPDDALFWKLYRLDWYGIYWEVEPS